MDSEETKNESEVPEPKKSSFWSETWDFIRTLVISMICVFLVAHFLVRPIRVQGNSMYPTLESESVGLANVLSVEMGDLSRFDIAIIYLPEKKEYLEAAEKEWEFIKTHQIDKRSGSEWFYAVTEEGEPLTEKPIVEAWKCPYHNGRMCIEVLRRCEK